MRKVLTLATVSLMCFTLFSSFISNGKTEEKSDAHYEDITYEELGELDMEIGDTFTFDEDCVVPMGTRVIAVDLYGNILFTFEESLADETPEEYMQRICSVKTN